VPPSRKSGRSHAITKPSSYTKRIEAINFAMANDDGVRPDNFHRADVVLIGVSRSGKTPTCLYLAMHYGLRSANYPVTEEDFERGDVPQLVWDCRHKLFALTIDPQRLQLIREERRPGSEYASSGAVRRTSGWRPDLQAPPDPGAQHHQPVDRGDLLAHHQGAARERGALRARACFLARLRPGSVPRVVAATGPRTDNARVFAACGRPTCG
jgi:hypothetical protein